MTVGKTVLVMAHPDDEVIFWPLIARAPADRLVLLYMTNGAGGGMHSPAVRAEETRKALLALGVDPTCAHFLGVENGINDGSLHVQLPRAWQTLQRWAETAGPIEALYTHAWEGGHQDHDSCHALALKLASETSVRKFGQVPGYRRPDRGLAPFSLLDPIPANGRPEDFRMTLSERMAMAFAIRHYPSQWKSWVGLGPPLWTRLAFSASYPLQPVSPRRVEERPHLRPLLYEVRRGPTFTAVQAAVRALISSDRSS